MAPDIIPSFVSSLGWFLARYIAVVLVFYMASTISEKAGTVARLLAGFLAMVFCALYGVFASIFLSLVGKSQIAQWATGRAFKAAMALATGVTFEIDDPKGILKSTRPAVFIGNHQSTLDVLMLGCMFPKYCSVTAKTSLKYYPILGWFMALSGTVFIDRASSKDARQAMSGAAEAIRGRRQSVYMFPEGTRSNALEPTLLNFKKGAFHLAVQAGVPIVPVVVANYSNVFSIKRFVFRSGRIPMKVLDPISTKNLTAEDVQELTGSTRDLMLKELIDISAKAHGQPTPVPGRVVTNGATVATGVEPRRTRRA